MIEPTIGYAIRYKRKMRDQWRYILYGQQSFDKEYIVSQAKHMWKGRNSGNLTIAVIEVLPFTFEEPLWKGEDVVQRSVLEPEIQKIG